MKLNNYFSLALYNYASNKKPFHHNVGYKHASSFYGRINQQKRLLDILKIGIRDGGSYLIAGMKGAGKTSFVEEVLRKHRGLTERNNTKLTVVKLNLSREELRSSKDIMLNINNLLMDGMFTFDVKMRVAIRYFMLILIWVVVSAIFYKYAVQKIELSIFQVINALGFKTVFGLNVIHVMEVTMQSISALIPFLIYRRTKNLDSKVSMFGCDFSLHSMPRSELGVYFDLFLLKRRILNSFETRVGVNVLGVGADRISSSSKFDSNQIEQKLITIFEKIQENNRYLESEKYSYSENFSILGGLNLNKMRWVNKLDGKIGYLPYFWGNTYNAYIFLSSTAKHIHTISYRLLRYVFVMFKRRHPLRQKINDVVIVFDELDKLGGREEGDENIDKSHELLTRLKSLISSSSFMMIFIGGRELYDKYLSDSLNASSLYKSLFKHHIYIPSFLTDSSDGNSRVLESMTETWLAAYLLPIEMYVSHDSLYGNGNTSSRKEIEKQAKIRVDNDYLSGYYLDFTKNEKTKFVNYFDIVFRDKSHAGENYLETLDVSFVLKIFTRYLVFHNWGNLMSLEAALSELVYPYESLSREEKADVQGCLECGRKPDHVLKFSLQDFQRIVLASQLYALFHHKLSRTLSIMDDKVVVTTFAVYHFILRFHSMSFSRGHIYRMYDALNINALPQLNEIADNLLDQVLFGHVRRVRKGLSGFRFTSHLEQEIHYIANLHAKESSTFNFSLDSMQKIKSYFEGLLDTSEGKGAEYLPTQRAEVFLMLGNFSAWEKKYDAANMYYEGAAALINNSNPDMCKLGDGRDNELYIHGLIEAMLRKGDVLEKLGDYSKARFVYMDVCRIVVESGMLIDVDDSNNEIIILGFWSGVFLTLKRSPLVYRDLDDSEPYLILKKLYKKLPPFHYFRAANYYFFSDKYKKAIPYYWEAYRLSGLDSCDRENKAFLGGISLLKISLSIMCSINSKIGADIWKLQTSGADIEKLNDNYTQAIHEKLELDRSYDSIEELKFHAF